MSDPLLDILNGGGQGAQGPAGAQDPLLALVRPVGTASAAPAAPAAPATRGGAPDPSTTSRVRAGAAGINKGFFANLLGLPVDTAANVIDLGKAGFGAAASAFGRPDLAPDLGDRSRMPGTSEWIASKINDVGLGGAINNPNPGDPMSRVMYSGGQVAGQSIVPNPRASISLTQNLSNMMKGGVSGTIGGAVGEVAPEWAGLAGMLSQAGTAAGAEALKRGVRGGEAGRVAMNQRLQDLQNGGIESPSVGLASGNRFVQGIENLLAQTPGSVGLYDTARAKNLAGMQNQANQVRDSISPEFGPVVAGEAIQNSIKGPFLDRFKATQSKLYDAVDAMIPGATKTQVKATADALTNLTSGIEGAPNIGDRFINGRISDINDAFRLDTGLDRATGAPRTSQTIVPGTDALPGIASRAPITVSRTIDPTSVYAGEGTRSDGLSMTAQNTPRRQQDAAPTQMRTTQFTIPSVPASAGVPGRPPITINRTIDPLASVAGEGTWRPPADPALPYAAVSKLRTQVGKELDGNMLMSDVPRSQWKQLYGSLSQDIGGAATAAGPEALGAWERANTYTKTGINRIDDLESLANRSTPEGAYGAVASSLNTGPTIYQRLRGAMTGDARQKVVATIVDEMGVATPGQQSAAGDTWSPKTFLTNYNRMDAGARTELFKRIPGGAGMADNLADIAKTADMLGDSAKVWANPSGTAPALMARGTAWALTAGAFFQPVMAAGTAAGLGLANQASQRLLLNPKFVNWLAKAPQVRPEQAQAYSQRLLANAKLTNDKQYQQDVTDYLRSVENGAQQQEGNQ